MLKSQPPSSPEGMQGLTDYTPMLSPGKAFGFLSLIISLLFSISSVLVFLKYYLQKSTNGVHILLTFFYLDNEKNIPTFFSTACLLVAAILLFYIYLHTAKAKRNFRYHWLALAFIFLLISMDEFMSVHELMIEPLQAALDLSGFFYFAWVIPGLLFVGFLGLFLTRFLLHLKALYRKQFILAAGIFIGGALGLEMVGGRIAYSEGTENFLYAIVANLEETLEMAGTAYFIFALLLYIRNELQQDLRVKIRQKKEPPFPVVAAKNKQKERLSRKDRSPAREKSRLP